MLLKKCRKAAWIGSDFIVKKSFPPKVWITPRSAVDKP
jgi:hypothetical protein